MRLSNFAFLSVFVQAVRSSFSFPPGKKLRFFLSPIDCTRYLEFSYLVSFLKHCHEYPINILDVSSPVMMAYMLKSKHRVILKTDINSAESNAIETSRQFRFQQEDATQLTFQDSVFDMVYSISVIEHIYSHYMKAIHEMIRVAKPGSYIYITFPVAATYVEEWLDRDIYSKHYRKSGKVFFQYRFGPREYQDLFDNLPNNIELVSNDIFWEKMNGFYDLIVKGLRVQLKPSTLMFAKDALINFIGGFLLFERHPTTWQNKSFGNAHVIMKKTT